MTNQIIASSLVFSAVLHSVAAVSAPLTMLTDSKAKCMDGTQAGYYSQMASNSDDKNKWVIYLEGGGECDTESACKGATSNSMGSSKYFPATSDPTGWFLGSDYCTYNPVFCGWNHARDPYCSQDLHTGQVTVPSDKTWGLYFAGEIVNFLLVKRVWNIFVLLSEKSFLFFVIVISFFLSFLSHSPNRPPHSDGHFGRT